jgi:hypothetical protein
MVKPSAGTDDAIRTVRVLELDPDLCADLDPQRLASAQADLIAPLAQLEWASHEGRWGPHDGGADLGLLVVGGLLCREVEVLGTWSAELLGSGDLLRPWDVDGEFTLPVPGAVRWTVLAPVEVAVLDAEFARRAVHFPEVLAAISGRGVARAKALALHQTMRSLKHVEARLLVQFWQLAERWGHVDRDGIAVSLPLTHELLAKLVGAARPSVTTALGRLAERELLQRTGDVWRLSGDSRGVVMSAF